MTSLCQENIEVLRSRLLQKDYYQATTLLTNFLRKRGYVAAVQLFEAVNGPELAAGVWQAAIASLRHTPEEAIVLDVLQDASNCHVASVEASGNNLDPVPPYSYSVGLWHSFWHGELICVGLPESLAVPLLRFYIEQIAAGHPPEVDQPLCAPAIAHDNLPLGCSLQFKRCGDGAKTRYLPWANWFNSGLSYPVLQLVWPDNQNQWPWDQDFRFPSAQPLLV